MKLPRDQIKCGILMLLLLCAFSLGSGCANTPVYPQGLPPILTQDELLRPYEQIATIEVHRDRYGTADDSTPDDHDWAYDALRHEAAKLKADAVILPEVNIVLNRYDFFPTSHISAKGIAIKFR